MKYAEFSTILNLIDVHNYRVTLVVAYLGWVDYKFCHSSVCLVLHDQMGI